MSEHLKLTVSDHAGDEVEIAARFEVCSECHGRGLHDHPAFSNGISASEMNDMDTNSFGSYMAGDYDVECRLCKGKRVVLVPDYENLTKLEQQLVDQEIDAKREIAAERRMEQRMGC